jgi:hypothetical protein
LEQSIVNRPGHRLAAQLGWFRESDASYARNLIGSSPPINTIQNVLAIDVNERRLDGSPNPFFLRPYFLAAHPTTTQRPLERDSYRGQIAYSLDLTKERTFLRWLGQHDLVGYGEYKNVVSRSLNFSDIIVDAHSWLPRGVWRGSSFANLPAGPASYTAGVNYWMYVGSRGGTRVETPPPAWQPGNYVLNWGNGVTGVFNQEPAQLGSAPTGGGTAGNSWTQLKARGAILQSRLLGDRLVPTFGYRFDKRYSRAGAPVTGDGVNLDYDSFYGWAGGDWNVGKGPTRTKGVVVKPTQWLSFYVNKSDSFQPATSAQTVYLKRLADPRGNGQDSGIWLNLFQNRLSIRAGQYKTGIVGTRNGTSGTLVTRALFIDRPNVPGQTGSARGYQLQPLATRWATDAAAARGVQLTQDQLTTEVAKIMGLDPKFLQEYSLPISSSDDTLATGEEIEINFNPTTFWTVKANLAQQESINKNLAPEISQWMQERIKVWSGIIDPQLGVPWYTHNYPGGVPADVVASTVMAPLALAQATEGKSRPQIRKYRFNLTSSFRLAALTDQTILKRINVGGAVRWEDRGAIGYRGLEGSTTAYDPNRPVYDKAHHYLDAFAAYRTRIGSNGMAATLQLNVRNLNESGRLQPVAVQPDGTPSAYRIIDPRLFILSLTLDL